MKVLNVQQLHDAPPADLYLCAASTFYQATPMREQAEVFLKHTPDGVVTLYNAVKPPVSVDPQRPSTWQKWNHANEVNRGTCGICGDHRVALQTDREGVARCASCWEDLQPCVNCGTVSTRPGGEHYCHPKKDYVKDGEPEGNGDDLNQVMCSNDGHDFVATGAGYECIQCGSTAKGHPDHG